ncbi:MAG TPA: glycosyltransferase family 4 protein [Stellaceae bacterium]|nr:glycosyltransferase family 4 protein [Stellaceae bacterium]
MCDTTPRSDPSSAPADVVAGAARPKLLFLVTEDWYFCSHRLPVARAARAAGFDVIIAARVAAHGECIRGEGFALRPLRWRRRGDGIVGAVRAIAEIARLYRAERPDVIHHVALKPILFGAVAARLAFGRKTPATVAAVMGLGTGFSSLYRSPLRRALRWALGRSRVIVQNPDDSAALAALGIEPARVELIRGSGVDIAHFAPLPEPRGGMTVALVARMLKSKGVLDAAAAIRRLRAEGHAVELVLAGPTDPDSADSLTDEAMRTLGGEPGIAWLGRVADVREVWRRAQIAVFPSTYGEGLPKSLLEAAACARPIVAADIQGTREIVRHGETGILVPPGDLSALAEAIAALAGDPARRTELGRGGRALVEREFAETIVAEQTVALYRRLLGERKKKP